MATIAMTRAGAVTTGTTFPNIKSERLTTPPGSDLRQGQIQFNALIDRLSAMLSIVAGDGPVTTSTPSIGTTNTFACSASVINITGTPITVAAETAKAFPASGTVPASTWALFVIERVANATTTIVDAAANYTTGYASEALALAAVPAKSASKAVVGYITIKASASTWIAGTDGLTGSATGNVATTTNYYPVYGYADTLFWSNFQIGNLAGTKLASSNY